MRYNVSRRLHRRLRGTRRQRGGGKKIVFYTCFFGPSGSVSHKIPPVPSSTYDCIYFTNNKDASSAAKSAGWTVVDIPVAVKESNRNNAVDSKEVKACPHHFKELNGYEYSCYFDSKLVVKEADVISMLDGLKGGVVMLVNKHPFIKNSVRNEFDAAMAQPRYAQNRGKYESLINSKLKSGNYKNKTDVHYETSCILRRSGDLVNMIGEEWYKDILETGAECQISFFFIQQKYKDNIRPLPVYYGR